MSVQNAMSKIILDASVSLKWFLDEIYSAEAIKLMEDIRSRKLSALVPFSFYTECANVLWEKTKKGMVRFERAHKALEDLRKLPLKEHLHENLEDVAYDNACIYGITVYDALYISLAEVYGAPLVTADDRLIRACKDRFDYIEHLRDYK